MGDKKSRTSMAQNPHCALCRRLGKRTAIRKSEDMVFPVSRLYVPATCLEDNLRCNELNTKERNACKAYYSSMRVLEEEDLEADLDLDLKDSLPYWHSAFYTKWGNMDNRFRKQ